MSRDLEQQEQAGLQGVEESRGQLQDQTLSYLEQYKDLAGSNAGKGAEWLPSIAIDNKASDTPTAPPTGAGGESTKDSGKDISKDAALDTTNGKTENETKELQSGKDTFANLNKDKDKSQELAGAMTGKDKSQELAGAMTGKDKSQELAGAMTGKDKSQELAGAMAGKDKSIDNSDEGKSPGGISDIAGSAGAAASAAEKAMQAEKVKSGIGNAIKEMEQRGRKAGESHAEQGPMVPIPLGPLLESIKLGNQQKPSPAEREDIVPSARDYKQA